MSQVGVKTRAGGHQHHRITVQNNLNRYQIPDVNLSNVAGIRLPGEKGFRPQKFVVLLVLVVVLTRTISTVIITII